MKPILKNKINILIILIFCLNIVCHFWSFWDPPLSGDEANQTLKAIRVANGIKNLVLLKDLKIALENIYEPILEHNHPPLEFLIFLPFIAFEPREFFVRLSSVVVNIGLLISIYLFLKKFRNKFLAISFFLLYATSLWAIWWGQSATVILNIAAAFFLILSLIYFLKSPCRKSLILMGLSFAFSMWVSIDYFYHIFFFSLAVFEKRKNIKLKDLAISALLFLFLTGIFYVPYVLYAFFGGPGGAGFNYYIHGRLAKESTIWLNIQILWKYAFSYPGWITIWPLSIFSFLLIRKVQYIKYVFVTAFSYILLFILFGSGISWYINIYSLIFFLGIEFLSQLKKYRVLILGTLFLINVFSLKILLVDNINNKLMFATNAREDQIKKVAIVFKQCNLSENEQYLTTTDPVTAEYYFKRSPYFGGNDKIERVAKMASFAKDDKELINIIKIIHYKKPWVDEKLDRKLTKKALQKFELKNDVIFLFKDCGIKTK